MKISKSIIAAAIVATLPLSAIAGDKDKTATTTAGARFETLDTNRDGRISATEASVDSKIVFSTADKNGDGYLDNDEYMHRSMKNDTMPSSNDPASSDADSPRN